MQDLLPVSVRAVKDDNLANLVCELSAFFKQLCAKELDIDKLDKLQSNVVITLCRMEKLFPASFFYHYGAFNCALNRGS